MTEDPRPARPIGSGGPMSERMQALLSRAAEEQLTEQRQVSAVLADLRGLVADLGEQLRGTASSARLESLHDRLAPLDDVRTGLAELVTRTAALEAQGPEVGAIRSRVEGLATSEQVARSSDALLSAVVERLDRLEARPALTQEALAAALAPLEARLGEVAERLSEVSDAAGGVPAVATDLNRMAGRLDEVAALRTDVLAVRAAVQAQQEDSPVPGLVLGVAALRADVEALGARVGAVTVPTAEAVAAEVGEQVTERLVAALAPRVADVVLTRVAATLVEQVSGSVTASVQQGLTEQVRAVTAESERRISAHVDEAVLALAEALLRRRRGPRPAGGADVEAGAGALPEGVPSVDLRPDDAEPVGAAPAPDQEPAAQDQELAAQDQELATQDQEPAAQDQEPAAGPPAQAAAVAPTAPGPSRPATGAPTLPVVPAPQGDDGGDDGEARRAWWRPGS